MHTLKIVRNFTEPQRLNPEADLVSIEEQYIDLSDDVRVHFYANRNASVVATVIDGDFSYNVLRNESVYLTKENGHTTRVINRVPSPHSFE